jgi:xylulokinase
MKEKYLLGIDVSTTAVKALLIDTRGQVKASASVEQEFQTPQPLWVEQDPHHWWQNTIISVRTVLERGGVEAGDGDVVAVGLTGQMHGLVLLDERGNVLRPAILWNDQRTGEECAEITELVGEQNLLAITGNRALTGFTAPKILWVRKHESQIYQRIAHILLPKDYVRYCLTGEFAVDKADGAGMLLFDLKLRDWSDEVLNTLQIPKTWLPKTFEGTEVTGAITKLAAEATGLRVGTPVVGGGGDQAAQAVGVGAVEPGIIALTLGTSGVVFASTDAPVIEPQGRLHAFCHSVPQTWHLMGVMLSAAGALKWYRDTLAPAVTYDELLAPAQTIAAGSEGLLFLPYLTGERTPHPDPLARAAFVGMTIRHTQAHMTRAVLEGVAFGLRDSMELMRQAGLAEIRQVRISGGGARSPLWRQILANVMDTEMVTVNTMEGAAYGAALLAGVGSGFWDSVQSCCQTVVHPVEHVTPQSNLVRIYRQLYEEYKALYPALKSTFNRLSFY